MADRPEILTPRERDPLVACIGQLAERFGVPFAPAMFSALARDADGRLPLHQAEPALELLGLNCDAARAEQPAAAAVSLSGDRRAGDERTGGDP